MIIEIIHGSSDDFITTFEVTILQQDLEDNSLIVFCLTLFNFDIGLLLRYG